MTTAVATEDSLPEGYMEGALLVDAKKVAEILGLARTTVCAMYQSGKIPAPLHLGGKLLWRLDELRRWVRAGCPGQARWESMAK